MGSREDFDRRVGLNQEKCSSTGINQGAPELRGSELYKLDISRVWPMEIGFRLFFFGTFWDC